MCIRKESKRVSANWNHPVYSYTTQLKKPLSWVYKKVQAFPQSIGPKVNIIPWLKFEFVYYNVAVHHFSPYAQGIRPPPILDKAIYISFDTNALEKGMNIHIYPTPPLGQDMTQGQFLSGVEQVWIQSFPSPRLVASPRLKNLVCPTIYP